jgi:hypothetical protein
VNGTIWQTRAATAEPSSGSGVLGPARARSTTHTDRDAVQLPLHLPAQARLVRIEHGDRVKEAVQRDQAHPEALPGSAQGRAAATVRLALSLSGECKCGSRARRPAWRPDTWEGQPRRAMSRPLPRGGRRRRRRARDGSTHGRCGTRPRARHAPELFGGRTSSTATDRAASKPRPSRGPPILRLLQGVATTGAGMYDRASCFATGTPRGRSRLRMCDSVSCRRVASVNSAGGHVLPVTCAASSTTGPSTGNACAGHWPLPASGAIRARRRSTRSRAIGRGSTYRTASASAPGG